MTLKEVKALRKEMARIKEENEILYAYFYQDFDCNKHFLKL